MSNKLISKPPFVTALNRTNPLSNGLVGSWIFNENGGDTVYNAVNSFSAKGTSTRWNGKYLENIATTDTGVATTDRSTRFTNESFTIVYFGITPTAAVSNPNIFQKYAANSGYRLYWVGAQYRLTYYEYSGSAVTIYANTLNHLIPGKYQMVALVKNMATATIQFYVDTVPISTPTTTVGIIQYDSEPNMKIVDNDKYFSDCCHVYNKALSILELKSLYIDPYQMFRTKPIWLYRRELVPSIHAFSKFIGIGSDDISSIMSTNENNISKIIGISY